MRVADLNGFVDHMNNAMVQKDRDVQGMPLVHQRNRRMG